MPWTQKQMLRDANGDLIPQYWDVVEQEFKPLTGRDGANDVRLTGSNVEEGIAVKDEIVKDLLEKIIERIGNNDYIFLENVPLSAGADIRFQTKLRNSKFYLFGRFNVSAQVLIEQRADPARYGTIVNSFQKIYEGNAVTIAPTRFYADYPHIEVRVTNQSEQDIIIRSIVISDMTGGDQSAISDLENAITALGGSV